MSTRVTSTVEAISDVSGFTHTCEATYGVGTVGCRTTTSVICRTLVDIYVITGQGGIKYSTGN